MKDTIFTLYYFELLRYSLRVTYVECFIVLSAGGREGKRGRRNQGEREGGKDTKKGKGRMP